MWKVRVTGQYITGFGNSEQSIEYDVTGYMPECSEIYLRSFCFARYLKSWVESEKNKDGERKYPIINRMRTKIIEHYEKDGEKSKLTGKDILNMSWDELRDFGTRFDIRDTKLKGMCSLKEARERACITYLTQIRKLDLSEFDEYEKVAGGYKFHFDRLKNGIKIVSDKKKEEELKKKSFDDSMKEQSKSLDDEFKSKSDKVIDENGKEDKEETKKKKKSKKKPETFIIS
jgi:hypothetical protein